MLQRGALAFKDKDLVLTLQGDLTRKRLAYQGEEALAYLQEEALAQLGDQTLAQQVGQTLALQGRKTHLAW